MSEKISDERLEHHIRWFASEVEPPVEPESVGLDDYELLSLLRELRDYRKAAREYLEAWDSDDHDADSLYEKSAELRAA